MGNLATRKDQIGQTTTYSYNDLYFLTHRTYPSAINDVVHGDLAEFSVPHAGSWPVTFTYDGASRITSTQNGKTTGYIPTVTYPGGRVITEQYDLRTRLGKGMTSLSPPPIAQYAYDFGNRVLTRADRNGTVTT